MLVATDVQYPFQVLGDLRLGLPGEEQGGTLPERQRSWYELALAFIKENQSEDAPAAPGKLFRVAAYEWLTAVDAILCWVSGRGLIYVLPA